MSYEYLSMKNLVGLKIVKSFGKDNLVIVTESGTFSLQPMGDCCASCYITDIDCSEALQGGTIKEIEDLVRELPSGATVDECSEVWGHRIHTDKGICTIGMRVDHNGYYSGWLQVSRLKNFDPKELSLTEDFS